MHPAFGGRCWAVVWVSVVIGASGCLGGDAGGVSSARSTTTPEHIRVTSTLSGLDVAPNHVHWIAEPSFKKADVREVRFYVDGKLSWIDPQKPYMYGGDGGYLVTTWLARVGVAAFTRHTFTTEAVAVDGSQAREDVVLRVRSVKRLPDLPYGIWGRPVSGPPWPRALNVVPPGVLWIGAPIENATAYEVRRTARRCAFSRRSARGPEGRALPTRDGTSTATTVGPTDRSRSTAGRSAPARRSVSPRCATGAPCAGRSLRGHGWAWTETRC